VYFFNSGDVVNFGSVVIGSFSAGFAPDGGPNQRLNFVEGGVTESFNSSVLPSLASPGFGFGYPLNPTYADLTFTIPAGADSIQLAWHGPSTYYPVGSIPEPSTWAMLLIGFAGISFMTYRRKSKPSIDA
jgi:hypothetical protein